MTEVPTPGRYLLYLDFQIDGKVHSAPFVVDATRATGATADHDDSMSDMGSDEGSTSGSHSGGESDADHAH